MAEISVRLVAVDDGEESRQMLRDFSSDIARLEGVTPSSDADTRGDPVTLGMIAFAAVKSGALTALINMIANYVNRDHRNEIEFSTANGEKIRVSSPCNLTELEGTVRRLFPASDGRSTRITTDNQSLRKIAILVANDKFEKAALPDLHCTQNDAVELQKILEDEICGFKTYLYLNESSYNIRANLDHICRGLTQDDTLLFYYAGHGKVDIDELCLITNDTTSESLDATSLRADQDVLRYFRRTLSKRKVMILDCCYAG